MITYNHEKYISKALDSILMQKTNFSYEIVIGEDCSTDKTRDILINYKKQYPDRFKLLLNEKNLGAYKNAHQALQACKGEYIAFLEGDDYWINPDKLQIQIEYMDAHPEVGLVHSDADMFNVKTGKLLHNAHKELGRTHDDNDENIYLRILEDRYHIITCTVCVRRDLLFQIINSNPYEFTSGAFLMGDTQTWLELARVSKIKFFPESLSLYNLLPESASRSADLRKYIRFIKSGQDLRVHYLEKYGVPAHFSHMSLTAINRDLLKMAYDAGDSDLAIDTMHIMRKYGHDISFKCIAWYLGAQYPFLRIVFSPLIYLFRYLRKFKRFFINVKSRKSDEVVSMLR